MGSVPHYPDARKGLAMSFDHFYSIYPRRINRALAEKKYNAAIKKGATHEQLANGAYEYAQWCQRNGTEKQYIAHPATWIGQERWHNDYRADDGGQPAKAGTSDNRTSATRIGLAAAAKVAAKGLQRLQQGNTDVEDPFWL
jgi:Uri superfamily endonuclease